MNRIQTTALLLAAYLVVWVQVSFEGTRAWFGAPVGLLPPLMVYAALCSNLVNVTLLAFCGGLWHDTFSANPLGVTTVALFVTGWSLHRKRELVISNQAYAQVVMGGVASALVPAFSFLLLMNLPHAPALTWSIAEGWMVMAVGGALFTPVIFAVFARLGRWFLYPAHASQRYRGERQIKRGRL